MPWIVPITNSLIFIFETGRIIQFLLDFYVSTNAFTTTAYARSTNKLTSTAASTAYPTHSPLKEFPSSTGFYPQPYPNQKKETIIVF